MIVLLVVIFGLNLTIQTIMLLTLVLNYLCNLKNSRFSITEHLSLNQKGYVHLLSLNKNKTYSFSSSQTPTEIVIKTRKAEIKRDLLAKFLNV